MKSRLLIGVTLAAFAFVAATDVSFAKASAKRHKAIPVASSTVPNCGMGMVPILHMGFTKNTWGCVKPG